MSDGMLEVRDIIHPDGTTERAYRIGTRDWVTCTSFEHSTVHVDAGPWQSLDEIPEGVDTVRDGDESVWVREGIGWRCEDTHVYEPKVYAPFVPCEAEMGVDVTEAVDRPKWSPPSGPSWYDLSEREFNR